MTKKEIIEGIKKEGMNFVATNYYNMSKEQLKELVLAFQNQTIEATKHGLVNYTNLAMDDLDMFLDD